MIDWKLHRSPPETEERSIDSQLPLGGCVAFIVAAVILFTGSLLVVNRHRESGPHFARCSNHLKQLGLSARMYALENENWYPPLPQEPGRLMFSDAMISQYVPDLLTLLCPEQKGVDALRKRISQPTGTNPSSGLASFVETSSYWYLGYTLLGDDDVVAFAEAYRKRTVGGLSITLPMYMPIERREALIMAHSGHRRSDAKASTSVNVSYDRLTRLREGFDRFFILRGGLSEPEHDSERFRDLLYSSVPVLLEMPGHHDRPGGNVLYFDGHVEFIPYPGKWPMTEKTIRILRELDTTNVDAHAPL